MVSPGTLAAVDVYVWLTYFQFSSACAHTSNKPSNQRHLPYSSAYSASKRALAPVPPLPTLTATIPPPIPPHRLAVLTDSSARGDFIAAASSSSSLSRAACRVSQSPSRSCPIPDPTDRMNRPQSWLISSSSMSSISSISSFVIEELVVIPARRLHRRGALLHLLGSLFIFFSPSQRSSQTPSCSLRVFLPNLHYP